MTNHDTPDVDYAPNGASIIPAPSVAPRKPSKKDLLNDGEAPEQGEEMAMIGKTIVIHALPLMHELITVIEAMDVTADQMQDTSAPRWPGAPSMNINPNAQMDPSKAFRPGK